MFYIGLYFLIHEFCIFSYCQFNTDTLAVRQFFFFFECVLMTFFCVRVGF